MFQLAAMPEVGYKFIMFSLVGIVGMAVDFGVTFLLKEKCHWNKYVANSIGFSLAVVNNYLLNAYWTYSERNALSWTAFWEFFFFNIVGLGINLLVIYCCNSKFKIPFYWSKIIASGFGTVWNFTVNHYWTFRG